MLMALGYFMAMSTGVIMPAFVFIFGGIINDFGDTDFNSINKQCLYMVYIGIGVWISSYCYFFSLVTMSERVGRKTKIAYLKALL
mmetsp:Transcript_8698/g.6453  ORF Transcript_8698/g.6453 Transcript_8698/m.6453 type:complete len:85 (+) Transcript_8698:325-579(+)